MKEKLKLITGNLVVTLCLLVMVETIFYLVRPKQYKDVGFLVNVKQATNRVDDPGFGATEVDALLGYDKWPEGLKQQGFKVEKGCIVLSTTNDTVDVTRILITGGSATDISLYPDNWPAELCKILKQRGIKARLYIGGVGGHNSGQEVLKLIRDELTLGPLIHISYSGADEFDDPSYVTKYEQNFYEKEFGKANTSWLMPNTVLFMRNLFGLNHPDVFLHPNYLMPPVKFWERNMGIMHGTAVEYNYRFLGVLQPPNADKKKKPGDDPKYYPDMQKAVARHPDYLADFSGILDNGKVIVNEEGNEAGVQQIIALNLCDTLVQRGLLKR